MAKHVFNVQIEENVPLPVRAPAKVRTPKELPVFPESPILLHAIEPGKNISVALPEGETLQKLAAKVSHGVALYKKAVELRGGTAGQYQMRSIPADGERGACVRVWCIEAPTFPPEDEIRAKLAVIVAETSRKRSAARKTRAVAQETAPVEEPVAEPVVRGRRAAAR